METKKEKDIICPKCGKVNLQARDDGYVEGPREYHASCWCEMTDEEQAAVWDDRFA